MAFIQKIDPTILNIKLTTKGREQLSRGKLKFSKFVVGDSEIDYNFIRNSDFNAQDFKILRPFDSNPDILSPIPRFVGTEPFNELTNIPFTKQVVVNTANPIGFFDTDDDFISVTGKTSSEYVKQADFEVFLNEVVGGNDITIHQSSSYGSNNNEPEVGDILMIKWTNPSNGVSTNTNTIDLTNPQPVLFYGIEDVSGTLSGGTATITVDRELPDFGGTGAGVICGGAIFTTPIEPEYIDHYISGAQRYPFWKMSIIFSEPLIGVEENQMSHFEFKSAKYAGFLSYIQNQVYKQKKLGVIHYSNQSPLNTYAEQLGVEEDAVPTLKVPTIMWHKSENDQMGAIFKAIGNQKLLNEDIPALNTVYYDLGDEWGNVVGKVFIDLKVFVIEDQELLFAMSYKANRSWTLPDFRVSLGDSIYECPDGSQLDFVLEEITT